MARHFEDDPNLDGPVNTPWVVWLALALIAAAGLWVAFTGPQDGDDIPTPVTSSVTTR